LNGLAIAIDYDRKSLFDITDRARFKPEFADIIKKAKDMIANYDATFAQNGKQNSAVYIFRSKNFYGMKDVQQIEAVAPTNGDVPTNGDDIISALPEAPEEKPIEVKAEESASNGE
jgi:hypothetical protein